MKKSLEQHADFNLGIIDVRLESLKNYVMYLKHLKVIQLFNGDMNTNNVLDMIIKDLESELVNRNNRNKL